MGDFNLPDNCTSEQVDEVNAEPDRDRVCGTCIYCIEECCDYGMCALNTSRSPRAFYGWDELMGYVEHRRVDMQRDACARWEEY